MSDCVKNCEAHLFMVETVKEIKTMNLELMRSQQVLENSIIKLTENLNELQRMNSRIDNIMLKQEEKEEAQDLEISNHRDFMNKAIGALVLATFVIPIIVSLAVSIYLK